MLQISISISYSQLANKWWEWLLFSWFWRVSWREFILHTIFMPLYKFVFQFKSTLPATQENFVLKCVASKSCFDMSMRQFVNMSMRQCVDMSMRRCVSGSNTLSPWKNRCKRQAWQWPLWTSPYAGYIMCLYPLSYDMTPYHGDPPPPFVVAPATRMYFRLGVSLCPVVASRGYSCRKSNGQP